jgi:hypothetical protein
MLNKGTFIFSKGGCLTQITSLTTLRVIEVPVPSARSCICVFRFCLFLIFDFVIDPTVVFFFLILLPFSKPIGSRGL